MTVLVTGGAGFIGSHVVDHLAAAGHEPRIFDLRPSPHHSPSEIEQVLGDVTDPAALDGALQGCEAIIHLAAVADVADVLARPDRAHRINAQGTVEVLEAARRAGVGRVIYGSTTWVYSDCAEQAVDEETPLPPPGHLYTATKLAGELYCRSYHELYGIDCTILRFGIPYGPRVRDATVIATFVAKAEEGEPLTVAGDGGQSRRFVYVEDLARGVVAALRPEAANRIYNLASQEEVSVLQIAEAVRGRVRDTGIAHTPARAGDFAGKHISSGRAERELHWAATTTFDKGFGLYLDWRRTRSHCRRVLILSADIGAGHDLPAAALAARLREESPGVEVEVADGLRAMGRLATLVIRDGSWLSFNWLPWLFEAQYFLLARFAPTRWLVTKVGLVLSGRRLLKAVRARAPDVVVSTYPGTTALLGELRRTGRLDAPVVSAITDLAGLRFWAHPGVDLHTITHPESIEEVERIAGPGSARWAQPPTSPEFLKPRARDEARSGLGLDEKSRVVVVSGGGWGIGDLEGAVSAALDVEGTTVVCLTGHSERARRRLASRFASDPRVRLIGFTDRMSDLLAAADALVHSTAGLTVLEAQIRGCPVISYGFAVGHIRANNAAYERFGLARVATSPAELRGELDRALAEERSPDPAFAALPSPAQLVLETKARVRPLPALRLRTARIVTAAVVTFLVTAGVLLNDYAYPVFAKLLDLQPMTAVATTTPAVGVLIDSAPQSAAGVARQLSRRGLSASFALNQAPSQTTLGAIQRRGDDAVPRLDAGGLFHSLGTRGRLDQAAAALDLGRRFFYEPGHDFTLGQYLLAHEAGGSPVRGTIQAGPDYRFGSLHSGEIVQVEADQAGTGLTTTLDSLHRSLTAAGLVGVPIGSLVDPGGD